VACVATTARPEFKDWGWRNFVELGKSLRHEQPDLRMTIVVSPDSSAVEADFGWLTVSAAPLPQCVDLFASASVVVGNDTGLTHLAALTRDRNGRSPNVVGLYNMHSFLKWSTGAVNHHALALPFSQMLAAADADVLLNQIKPELWGNVTNLQNLPVDCVEAAVRMFLKDGVSPRGRQAGA
jgi:ADP-heptose:LPS heptosyltransferase